MARLETQINQIYLTHPEAKNASLILYEEALSSSCHLFVLAELKDLQKKSEANSLKKISEIILASFRANKRLAAEALFETTLAQINQNLADLAHEGTKSWVGKFSALLAIRSGDNIYLASNGQTCAYLKRNSDLLEILGAEKRGTHPLKSFQNFTQGKLLADDALILTTANVFNFVSFELFSSILDRQPLDEACLEISKILQDSRDSAEAFCSFFIGFSKKTAEAPGAVATDELETVPDGPIYAPLPEETEGPSSTAWAWPAWLAQFHLPSLPAWQFRLPKINKPNLPKLQLSFFKRLTLAGKFFFISFSVFLILFVINLSIYGFKLRSQRIADQVNQQAALVDNDIAAVQSALIYKDDQQAQKLFTQAQQDLDTLKSMDASRTADFTVKFEQLANQVNKTSVVNSPKVYAQFTHHPSNLAKTPTGFLLSGVDSNSVSSFDGTNTQDYFLLNSIDQNITSVAYWAPVGPALAVSDKIYLMDPTLKQYEPFVTLDGAQIDRIKTYNNNLYALDTKNGKLYRITQSKGKFTTQVAASGNFAGVRDFGIDKDIYLLSADQITKITGSTAQVFPLPFMTDSLTNGTRIFIASNIYVLEPNKKRVIIMSPTGDLINQIAFPTTNTLLDFYVDEASRSLYLLDDNLMYRITF